MDGDALLESSMYEFTNPKAVINFSLVGNLLKQPEIFLFDQTWTKHIYNYNVDFNEIIDETQHSLESDDAILSENELQLRFDLIVWLQESTIRKIRDKASAFLLEYSTNNPRYIFTKVLEFSNIGRLYIYERLVGICYGVCLRRQNDNKFVEGELREFTPHLYDLQFSEKPQAPVYNYIVIDSLKHIIDLAILKEVYSLDEVQLERLNNYSYNIDEPWVEVLESDIAELQPHFIKWSLSGKEPIRGDFYIYTIPSISKRRS